MRTRAVSRQPARARPPRYGPTAAALLTAALLTAGALAACGGPDDAGSRPSATQQLAATKATVDAATSMHLTLRSSGIPASVNGALGADGSGTHAPAFKGTLDARISGLEAKIEVVAINRLLYVKLPFTTAFVQADPKEYNAPDPARLFATEGGITSLLTATTAPVEGAKIRVGSDVLRQISGTLPGASVTKLLNIGDATKPFKVTYGITEPGGELRTVTMTGAFYDAPVSTSATSARATSTYVLTLDRYGDPVEISKP